MEKYLVTGASGNVGKYVVDELIALNKNVNIAVHNLSHSKEELVENDQSIKVNFDFLDQDTFDNALDGVRAIFLVRPPQLANPEKDMMPFLQAAKAKGVNKIVFMSLLGVEQNPVVPHRKIENMIKELEIPYVFLRPSFFMQNLNTNHRDEIKDQDELFIPAGNSKTSFIDTRDIAKAAAISLTDDQYINVGITLTGNEAIDYHEVATTLSTVLDRKIDYKNPGLLKFRKERIRRGTPKAFANVMTLLYLMTKLGTAKDVTPDLEELIGSEPISFKQYVIDHKEYWS